MYEPASVQYMELQNRADDCKTPQFARRYPQACAEILLFPPPSFWSMWVSTSVERASLCGPVSCEMLYTTRGMVLMIVFVVVTYMLKRI